LLLHAFYLIFSVLSVGQVDVLKLIQELRNDRMALVQHANQYALIHQACINHAIISNKELVVDGAEYTASPSKPVSIFIHA
jgi:hypothetical protein